MLPLFGGDDLVPRRYAGPARRRGDDERGVPGGGTDSGGAAADPQKVRLFLLEAQAGGVLSGARRDLRSPEGYAPTLARIAAEFDNFKKRALKEKEDVQRFRHRASAQGLLAGDGQPDAPSITPSQHDPRQVIEGVGWCRAVRDDAGQARCDGILRPGGSLRSRPATSADAAGSDEPAATW